MSDDAARKIMAGGRLRRLRQELGLSQTGMATELGISVSYLNLIERNQRPVTAQVLIRLAEVYDIDPREFAREEELRIVGELEEIFADPLFSRFSRPARRFARDRRYDADARHRDPAALRGLWAVCAKAARWRTGPAMRTAPRARRRSSPSSGCAISCMRPTTISPELEAAAERVAQELGESRPEPVLRPVGAPAASATACVCRSCPLTSCNRPCAASDRHRRRLMISELVEPSGRTFQAAYQLAFAECAETIARIADTLESRDGSVRRLVRITLANYFAAARDDALCVLPAGGRGARL